MKILQWIETTLYLSVPWEWNSFQSWLHAAGFGFALLIPLLFPNGLEFFLLPLLVIWGFLAISRFTGSRFTRIILRIQKRE